MSLKFIKRKKKFGIAFGGGGVRGVAEIGILKALEDNHIPYADMASGTSVGSLIGASYALGYSSEELLNYTVKIGHANFMNYSAPSGDIAKMVRSFLDKGKKFSIVKDSAQIEKLAYDFFGDKKFEDTKIPFYAVAVDLKSGKEVILNTGSLARACRASSSIPGIFTPTLMNDMILCDGYILNNLPADILRNKGMEVILGINITSNAYEICKSEKYFDVLFSSIEIMSTYGKIKNLSYCDILVQPELDKYKGYKLKDKAMIEMYYAGYEAMQSKMSELKTALGIKN